MVVPEAERRCLTFGGEGPELDSVCSRCRSLAASVRDVLPRGDLLLGEDVRRVGDSGPVDIGEGGLRDLCAEKVGVTKGETGAGTKGGRGTVDIVGRDEDPAAGHCHES